MTKFQKYALFIRLEFRIWNPFSQKRFCRHLQKFYLLATIGSLPTQYPSRKLDLERKMEDDVSQHDCDEGTEDCNPGSRFSEGIEECHEAEGHEQKTDPGQKSGIQKKGDDGYKNITPFQAFPRIRQRLATAFAQNALHDEGDGKDPENQT